MSFHSSDESYLKGSLWSCRVEIYATPISRWCSIYSYSYMLRR